MILYTSLYYFMLWFFVYDSFFLFDQIQLQQNGLNEAATPGKVATSNSK